jgi:WD40-like Beta Propeller Repeat
MDAQETIAPPQQYAPSYYTGTQSEAPRLVVFPPGRLQVVIPLALPSLLRALVFAPDGRAIFTIKSPRTASHPARLGPPRLIRVDLGPVRVTTMADLVGLTWVAGIAVAPHRDKILFTAGGWKGNVGCDLFEIEPSGGDLKMVLANFGCAVGSISPDGNKMLVPRDLGLAMVDLAARTGFYLGDGLSKGAWSPDGRWIAALRLDTRGEGSRPRLSRTVLVDANDLSLRRELGGEGDHDTTWSPDSRYLLYSEWSAKCPGHNAIDPGPTPLTLFTMDVEAGKRSAVKGSHCKVNAYLEIGWVSLDAVQ